MSPAADRLPHERRRLAGRRRRRRPHARRDVPRPRAARPDAGSRRRPRLPSRRDRGRAPDRLIPNAVSVRDGVLRIEGAQTGTETDAPTRSANTTSPTTTACSSSARASVRRGRRRARPRSREQRPRHRRGRHRHRRSGGATVDGGSRGAPRRPPGAERPRRRERARVLDLAERAGPDDLVLAAITGGGSALLAAPAEPITPTTSER